LKISTFFQIICVEPAKVLRVLQNIWEKRKKKKKKRKGSAMEEKSAKFQIPIKDFLK